MGFEPKTTHQAMHLKKSNNTNAPHISLLQINSHINSLIINSSKVLAWRIISDYPSTKLTRPYTQLIKPSAKSLHSIPLVKVKH